MTFDKEMFCKDVSECFENPIHKAFVNTKLRNDGEDIQVICDTGLAQLQQNFDDLVSSSRATQFVSAQ
uniref:Uncharacterized protein n=1 Tax=Candidatus Kentrum sp. MB TaxID=2138164 RepID=A0A451BG75_9GAMM|nr:MAG: hypothetical protein BECKMB1821G_GA0114241_10761 [Candidatus Kentron sp. MB]VFK35411.1 MAG: hypothetical protein BECKMB1821I_GA0114274_11171 [Candidatus Kentron sp. MB]VFK77276.1 MAG: hypothetical protein BECKMB1821H_GA0114242_11181 [Candidatus Kentron sp. MB]